jgi:hypothetical protein
MYNGTGTWCTELGWDIGLHMDEAGGTRLKKKVRSRSFSCKITLKE